MELPDSLRPQVALVLVKGSRTPKQYMQQVEGLLKQCGLPHQVFDRLTQQEMWSMFKKSSLAIMTPKTDGTPNSALEAMAAKCPLILGSFKYDEDLFSEEFCHRMKSDSVARTFRIDCGIIYRIIRRKRLNRPMKTLPKEVIVQLKWNGCEKSTFL